MFVFMITIVTWIIHGINREFDYYRFRPSVFLMNSLAYYLDFCQLFKAKSQNILQHANTDYCQR